MILWDFKLLWFDDVYYVGTFFFSDILSNEGVYFGLG